MRDPLMISDRLCIVPPGSRGPGGPDVVTVVVPLGAFGSGEHETTASCLEAIEGLPDLAGAEVLDVGSGTGILAVAALELGAESAVCVDTAPGAVATTKRTAVTNGLLSRVTVVLGTVDALAHRAFHLVLANLHGGVLLDLAETMVGLAAPGATVILSGIAWEDAYPVRERFRALGCEVLRERWLEEYVTMVLKRGG